MQRIVHILIFTLLISSPLSAQISVECQVWLGQDDPQPFSDWGVELLSETESFGTQNTNDNGQVFFSVDTPDTTEEWTLRALDLCTFQFVEEQFTVTPDTNSFFGLLSICTTINPPPPEDTCDAFFSFEIEASNPLGVFFTNLSTSSGQIDSVRWSFGDGNTSNTTAPSYTYASSGTYSVSLTIFSGTCIATRSSLVTVFDPDECDCPDEIDPVCVVTVFGELLTFDNLCIAACATAPNAPVLSDCNPGCDCPSFEAPVCVEIAGDTLTFTNHCFAECEGYTTEDWFECLEQIADQDCNCANTPQETVCIELAGIIYTFSSACEAACNGFLDVYSCDAAGNCACPDFFDPVCVVNEQGDTLTFDNLCFAECAGYNSADWFECEAELCACPANNNPVCVAVDSSTFLTFPNPCLAECSGYGNEDFVDCEFECNCPSEGESVCVLLPELGILATFSNTCEAACYGFSESDFVSCDTNEDPETCQCQDSWAPVCIPLLSGDTLTYQNACLAACEGFTETDFVECIGCYCEAPNFPACFFDSSTQEVLTFDNLCDALCAGYPQEELFYCFNPEECDANFDFEAVGIDNLSFLFEDLSTSPEAIDSWLWSFGDGNSSSEANPIHTYDSPGFYEVTLLIAGADCQSTITKTVIVGGADTPECQAFFFFEQPDSGDLLSYQFIDISLGNIQAWVWDFGDGTTSFEQNPMHTYAEAGSYNVNLTLITTDECASTITIVVAAGENIWYGNLNCRAWFLPVIYAASNEVYFYNLSSSDAIGFEWDFGDGTVSTDFQPFYQYSIPDEYTVSLTITTADGCQNTFSVDLNISDENFTSNPGFLVISSISSTNKPTMKIRAFPNPFQEQVSVLGSLEQVASVQWTLFDIHGKAIQQGQQNWQVGENRMVLDLNIYPAGIYFIRLRTSTLEEVVRLVKM